jgi:cytochrome bd-type quinol oxidase subunit 2
MITSVLSVALLATPIVAPVVAYAQDIQQNLCSGAEFDLTGNKACESGSEVSLNGLIETIINIISVIVGVVAVIMIIIGGLKYITSSGDSGNVTSAKNTILYAIVGLVVVALAQFVVRFVLSQTP